MSVRRFISDGTYLYRYLANNWAMVPVTVEEHFIRSDYMAMDIDRILGIYTQDRVINPTYYVVICAWDCLKELLNQVSLAC